jgi:hypothetical protein
MTKCVGTYGIMVKFIVTTYISLPQFTWFLFFVRADAGIVVKMDHSRMITVFLDMMICVLIGM